MDLRMIVVEILIDLNYCSQETIMISLKVNSN